MAVGQANFPETGGVRYVKKIATVDSNVLFICAGCARGLAFLATGGGAIFAIAAAGSFYETNSRFARLAFQLAFAIQAFGVLLRISR